MSEARETVEIVNERGLHARAAARLVQLASRFGSHIELEKDGRVANGKSIMGVLLLCGQHGARLTITASGGDASDAVLALGDLVRNRFGEDR